MHEFNGFWKDVGTIASYHETSMDLLGPNPSFDLYDMETPIMSNDTTRPPHYIGPDGRVDDCLVSNGCKIMGTARHSIISTDCVIEERAIVEDSVLLPGAVVKSGAHVCRAIMGENSVAEEGVKLGSVDTTKDNCRRRKRRRYRKGGMSPMNNLKALGYITANYSGNTPSKALGEPSHRIAAVHGPLPPDRLPALQHDQRRHPHGGPGHAGQLPLDHRPRGPRQGLGARPQEGGLFLLPGNPYGTTKRGMRFLLRDIISNKTLFQRSDRPYVVMMGSNIIFNMDLNAIIDAHEASGAGITMVYVKAERPHADINALNIGDRGRVKSIKVGCEYGDNKFLDCFIINRDLLLDIIDNYQSADYLDLFEAIAGDFERIDVCSYEFKGLAVGVFNEETYYWRSMEQLDPATNDQLFVKDRPIRTKAHDAPPAKYSRAATPPTHSSPPAARSWAPCAAPSSRAA